MLPLRPYAVDAIGVASADLRQNDATGDLPDQGAKSGQCRQSDWDPAQRHQLRIRISMHEIIGKRRKADGDVLCTVRLRSAVADPLVAGSNHDLAGLDIESFVFRLDHEDSPQDEGKLVEFGPLAGLFPASRARHSGNADPGGSRIHAAHEHHVNPWNQATEKI